MRTQHVKTTNKSQEMQRIYFYKTKLFVSPCMNWVITQMLLCSLYSTLTIIYLQILLDSYSTSKYPNVSHSASEICCFPHKIIPLVSDSTLKLRQKKKQGEKSRVQTVNERLVVLGIMIAAIKRWGKQLNIILTPSFNVFQSPNKCCSLGGARSLLLPMLNGMPWHFQCRS